MLRHLGYCPTVVGEHDTESFFHVPGFAKRVNNREEVRQFCVRRAADRENRSAESALLRSDCGRATPSLLECQAATWWLLSSGRHGLRPELRSNPGEKGFSTPLLSKPRICPCHLLGSQVGIRQE